MDRIERIQDMERRMDRVRTVLSSRAPSSAALLAVQADVRRLEGYYASPLWLEDYEADETGLLPAWLRRGVLSEDALYDLLEEYREALVSIEKITGRL